MEDLDADPLDPNFIPNYESNQNQTEDANEPKEPPIQIKTEPVDFETEHPNDVFKKKKKREIIPPVRKRAKRRRVPITQEVEDMMNLIQFYCCAVCEAKFPRLQELQRHVTKHKDRVTSWEHKVNNQKLRRAYLKAQKKLKKIIKLKKAIKEEKIDPEYNDPTAQINNDLNTNNDNEVNTNNEKPDLCTELANEISTLMASFSINIDLNAKIVNLDEKGKIELLSELEKNVKQKSAEGVDENLSKIFKCGGCAKQFSLGYYLKLHVRTHTGEKPYVCQECGESFVTASHLGRHRKRTHLALRVECRVCRQSYTRREFLVRHFNKYHADDKIEGEPYDYNAILPYLKELEEELRLKKEEEQRAKQESEEKKSEPNEWMVDKKMTEIETKIEQPPFEFIKPKAEPEDIKEETDIKEEEPAGITPEMVAFDFGPMDGDIGVDGDIGDMDGDDGGDEDYVPEARDDDDQSDEDYFPEQTWLPEAPAPPEPKPKRTKFDKNAPVVCEICKKRINSRNYLRVHMYTHMKERPFKCHICDKRFITSSKRSRHILTHKDWEIAASKKPDSDEEVPEGSEKRRKRKSRKSKQKCPIPNNSHPEYDDDGKRINLKRKPRPYPCPYCKKRFIYLEALQVHKRCHRDEAVDLHCSYCLQECESEQLLYQHEATHVGPRPYLCTICSKTYAKKETMIYHRRMHEAENTFQCDVCPKAFNARCKLQRHLVSHRTGKWAVRYECPVCAHCFRTRWHIEMHLSTHEKEGLITQENRGQVLAMVMQNARKIQLDQPEVTETKQLDPSDDRSRVCNICGEVFTHFYLLEQHLKSHGSLLTDTKAEERRFICPVCNKAFKLSYYLKLHSYTHTKERPYICQQCGKGFITKGKLKRHIETHTGVKKYQCHICCKFFTRPSYLRIHVRTIHGTQDYNFKLDYCNEEDDLSIGLQD